MREKVEAAIERIRPALQADGGDIELVDITKDGVVQVKLRGACAGCPMSAVTMGMVVEREIKRAAPEVKRVQLL
ncbi:MAG: NifU family protein [Candidatus Hadarchaeota archaeon]